MNSILYTIKKAINKITKLLHKSIKNHKNKVLAHKLKKILHLKELSTKIIYKLLKEKNT